MRHYTGYLAAFAFPSECVARLRRDARLAPLAGRFGEHLDRGCPDRLAPDWRRFDATLDGHMSPQALWLDQADAFAPL